MGRNTTGYEQDSREQARRRLEQRQQRAGRQGSAPARQATAGSVRLPFGLTPAAGIAIIAVLVVVVCLVFGLIASMLSSTLSNSAVQPAEQSEEVEPEEQSPAMPASLPTWVDKDSAKILLAATDDEVAITIANQASDYEQFGEDEAAKLLKLAANEPEAREYVADFPSSYPADGAGTLTDKDLTDGIPLLMQWDQRWGYCEYIGGPLGTTGCCPTCMSMLYCGLVGKTDMSPADFAQLATDNGYCNESNGTYGEFVPFAADWMGLECQTDLSNSDDMSYYLDEGYVIVCNMGPGTFTDEGHYIIVTSTNDDGSVNVNDPYSAVRSSQTWSLGTIASEIYSAYAVRA